MVGASHASVTNLTIDFAPATTHSNGVVMLPDGVGYAGTTPTDCEISNVEVIGGGNFHAYLIWNFRGRRVRILNNRIDGRVAAGELSVQEGIESASGKDVLIAGNDVRNVGGNGIFAVSGGAPGDEEERVQVTGNHVANSGNGITVAQLLISATGPGLEIRGVTVEGNVVENTWWTGIKVQLIDPGGIDGLRIRGNRVSGVGLAGQQPGHGIYMAATEAYSLDPSRMRDVVVEENQVDGPFTGDAIHLSEFPAVTVRGNQLSGAGIHSTRPDSVVITGNTVRGAGGSAIHAFQNPNRVWITGNTVLDWSRATAGQPGISVENAAPGARVRGNRLGFAGADPPTAVRVDPSSHAVVVFGNELLDAWGAGDAFVNAGFDSNLGSFEAAAGQATLEVSAAVAKPTSTIVIVQASGAPLAAMATPGAGGFAVRFATPPVGGERFRYEIDP
jgi:nitrous oxidase accessory protein NosD